MTSPPAPRALPAPKEAVVVMNQRLLDSAIEVSRISDRKRVILPFHKDGSEPSHRMFNAMQPGTYVQPHRHLVSQKTEGFLVLRGAIDFVVFDDAGGIELVCELSARGDAFGIDLAPGKYHSFLVREADTVVYEVKPGPYAPHDDKDFAPWAPREGTPEVATFMAKLDEALRGPR